MHTINTLRSPCDNDRMADDSEDADDDERELFPIAYSTAYLGLAALLTIRQNIDGDFDAEAVEYATRVCEVIKAQPETILTLAPDELEQTGPSILDNCRAWLD